MKKIFTALICLGSAYLAAQASVDHTDPDMNAELTRPPQKVRIWFDVPLDGKENSIQVKDEKMNRVDKNDTYLFAPKAIEVSLGDLKPGLYYVFWNAYSNNKHTTGDFQFNVK